MPAKSVKQRQMMSMALAMKKGKMPKKGHAAEVAKQMTVKQLEEFAKTGHKKLPVKAKRR